MYILPAIDIIGGKAVRLTRGDFGSVKKYSDDPVEIAKEFADKGAEFVHIVDLDGAKYGLPANFDTVSRIIKVGISAEVGGGIRDVKTVEKYLSAGASRVILGTAAIQNTDFLAECIDIFGDKIAVGADIKDGFLAVNGWMEKSEISLDAFIDKIQKMGAKTLICTDISRDGEMKGTNLELYRHLTSISDLKIIASGGISSVSEIYSLKNCGVYGAIIGKAYYEGMISLEDAITAAR